MGYNTYAYALSNQDINSNPLTILDYTVDADDSLMAMCYFRLLCDTAASVITISVSISGYLLNGQSITRIKPAGVTEPWYQLDPVYIPVTGKLKIEIQSDNANDSAGVNINGTVYKSQQADVRFLNANDTSVGNLETSALAYSATRGLSGTALPDAVAAAAGGLPISDAGGLDMDALAAKTAANSSEALRGIPAIVRFSTDGTPTAVTITGPNSNLTALTGTLTQLSGDNWQFVFTPDYVGPWLVAVNDTDGYLLHSERVDCVDSTALQNALGLQPPQHAPVTVWPEALPSVDQTSTLTNGGAGQDRLLFGVGKWHVPYRGWIYGIKLLSKATLGDCDTVKFCTLYPDDATDVMNETTWHIRGVSENFAGELPEDGVWSDWWDTYYFKQPVWAEAGDAFGFYMDDAGGSVGVCTAGAPIAPGDENNSTILQISTPDFTGGDSTSIVWGGGDPVSAVLNCKLLMKPVDIVLGGDSVIGGHCIGGNPSATVFENHDATLTYVPDYDPGAMLAGFLGVTVCNVADGGRNITNYLGADGLFEQNIAPLRPSMVIYDSMRNDCITADITPRYDPSSYPSLLGHLLAHCNAIGAQLVLLESVPSREASDQNHMAYYKDFMDVAAAWAAQNGVPYIALNHPLGVYGGVEDEESQRWYQAMATDYPGIEDYAKAADAYCHLTDAGRYAAMSMVATALKMRTAPSRFIVPRTTRTEIMPSDAMVGLMRGTDSAATAAALATHDGKLDTVDGIVDDIVEDTNELQGNQGAWATATGFSTHDAATLWAYASRTLTGTAAATGPTAMTTDADGIYTVSKDATLGLYKRVTVWDGSDIQQADVDSLSYSIYALSSDDEDTRTAISGHTAVVLDKADVIFDAVQADDAASDYNFRLIPSILTSQAFTDVGTTYLVDVTINLTGGEEPRTTRFRVTAI